MIDMNDCIKNRTENNVVKYMIPKIASESKQLKVKNHSHCWHESCQVQSDPLHGINHYHDDKTKCFGMFRACCVCHKTESLS